MNIQRQIMERHLANDVPFLNKRAASGVGFSGGKTSTFSGSYELNGYSQWVKQLFLPIFSFTVGTAYEVDIPSEDVGSDFSLGKTLQIAIRGEDGTANLATFNELSDLFILRNSAALPVLYTTLRDQRKVQTGFYLEASSYLYGIVHGEFDLHHPDIEERIDRFLSAIDRRFPDYMELQRHFRPLDEKGKRAYPTLGKQLPPYYALLAKLDKAMFKELVKSAKGGRNYMHHRYGSKVSSVLDAGRGVYYLGRGMVVGEKVAVASNGL